MSEHKKFDDYIKRVFENEPEVPSELAWESMGFDLPAVPRPENKSTRKYLLLLLLLLIGGPAIYFGLYKNADTKTLIRDVSSENILNNNARSLFESREADCEMQKVAKISTSLLETKENTVDDIINAGVNINDNHKHSLNTSENAINIVQNKPQYLENFQLLASKANENIQNVSKSFSENVIIPHTEEASKKDKSKITTSLPVRRLGAINVPVIDNNLEEGLELNLGKEDDNNGNDNKEKLFQVEEILVEYGYNHFNLKTTPLNILDDKVSGSFGKSFAAGLRLKINDKWKSKLSLNYTQYHSVFEHNRDLESIIDLPNLIKTNREELIYHNNYTNTFGLQLGAERHFKIANKLSLYAGLTLSPTYIISTSGKTTVELNGEASLYDNQIGNLSLSGGLNTGLIIPMNRSINLELNYQFNQVLLNEVFINNGIQANRQTVLSMIISYKLF